MREKSVSDIVDILRAAFLLIQMLSEKLVLLPMEIYTYY